MFFIHFAFDVAYPFFLIDNCRRLRRILSFVDRLIASNRTLGIVVEQQQHRSRSWSRDTTDKGDRDKDDGGNEKEESKQKKETTMSDDGDQLEREILARLNRLTLDSNAHRRDVLRLGNEAFVRFALETHPQHLGDPISRSPLTHVYRRSS